MKKSELKRMQIIGCKLGNKVESIIITFEDKLNHLKLFPESKIKWQFNWLTGLNIPEYSEPLTKDDYLDIKEHLIFKYGIVFKKTGLNGGDYNKKATLKKIRKE